MTGDLKQIKNRFCMLVFLCLAITLLQAQDSSTISLQRLVNAAMVHSPQIKSGEALVSGAKEDIKSVKNAYLPTAVLGDEINISSDNSLPGSYLSFGVVPSTSAGVRENNTLQAATGNIALLMSQYELASFGYKDARLKNASSIANLRQSDVDRNSYLLKWRISKLYFTLLKQQLQLNIEAQNIKRYKELFNIIRGVTIAGLRAGSDSSQALAELSKSRVSYNDVLKQTRLLKQEISYLSAIGADSVSVDTTAMSQQMLVAQLMQNNNDSIGNPLLDYYKTQQDVLQSNEDLVAKSYRPHLMLTGITWARGSSLNPYGDYKALGNGLGFQRYNYMAGVSLFYNLFSGIQKKSHLAASRYNKLSGAEDLQQQKESLENISQQADASIDIAYQNLQQLPVQIQAATDVVNQKTAQYKAGLINLVDLTNATYILYRAQTDFTQALNDWFLSNVDKAAVTGKLDLFIQSLNK